MQAPIADPETEVHRLKSLISELLIRANRVLSSSEGNPRQEIIDLREYAAYVGREVDSPPVPPHLIWMNHAGAVESVLSHQHRPN